MSDQLSSAILRFIAHLVSKDFDQIPTDLDAMVEAVQVEHIRLTLGC